MAAHYDSHDDLEAGAEKITRLSTKFRIPLPEDAGVVAALSRLDLTEAIPPEFYALINTVLAFVHRMDAELPLPKADPG